LPGKCPFSGILFVHPHLQTWAKQINRGFFVKGSIPLHLKSSAAWENGHVTGEIPAIIRAKDIEHSLQFYRSLLLFDLAYRWPPEGPVEYAFLRSGEIAVWIVAEGMVEKLRRTSFSHRNSAKLELHIGVDDVAATAGRLLQKGAHLVAASNAPVRDWANRGLRGSRWQSNSHSS